ncbi:hypothetical protein QQ045_014506 [Rhodiola kirilowii]
MGSCLSSSAQPDQSETATVIAVNGELRECPTPINVLQVLTMLFKTQADHDDSSFGYVLCNSDSLCYDDYIPAMKFDEHLQPSQIYFLVPTTRLQYRLSATDMAAMAVKASLALQKRDGKRKKASISPVSDIGYHCQQEQEESRVQETITLKKPDKNYYVRSGSIKRLQRYSSRRAKLAVRSFRLMLSTIYE